MKFLCKILGHRWTNVVEYATFSKSEYFYECSRCGLKEEGKIKPYPSFETNGLILRKRSKGTIIRPKENDFLRREST